MNSNQGTKISTMTIAIVASSSLPLNREVQQVILAALTFLPDGSAVRVRESPAKRGTSPTEDWLIHVSHSLSGFERGWGVVAYASDGQIAARRNSRLVQDADRVIAFFSEDRFMDGGTGNVVQLALIDDIPVEAWVVRPDGSLDLVAEYEHGVQKEGTWAQSRNVAKMVLTLQSRAMTAKVIKAMRRSTPPSTASRSQSAGSTPTGSPSTGKTGAGKSRSGSIFQGPTGSDRPRRSPRSSMGT